MILQTWGHDPHTWKSVMVYSSQVHGNGHCSGSFWACLPILCLLLVKPLSIIAVWKKLWMIFLDVLLQAADTQVVSDYVRYFLNQHTWGSLLHIYHTLKLFTCVGWEQQLGKYGFEVLVYLSRNYYHVPLEHCFGLHCELEWLEVWPREAILWNLQYSARQRSNS
jgi:hypothetical protein